MPEVVPTAGNTALVVIDMQYLDAHPDFGLARRAKEEGRFQILNHLFARLPLVIHNIRRVQNACRQAGIEVIFIKIQSYTQDGRDLSPSYKTKGLRCPPGSSPKSWTSNIWDSHVSGCQFEAWLLVNAQIIPSSVSPWVTLGFS
jgi:nicotinamidase-related amidase